MKLSTDIIQVLEINLSQFDVIFGAVQNLVCSLTTLECTAFTALHIVMCTVEKGSSGEMWWIVSLYHMYLCIFVFYIYVFL